MIIIIIILIIIIICNNVQVLLVTGGMDNNWNPLDSTELLFPSDTSWTIIHSAALPSSRYDLRGATLNNKVVITGSNMDTLIFVCEADL